MNTNYLGHQYQQKGVVTIEFALSGVVMILVILSLIDIGNMMFEYLGLNEAARKGVRLAAVCDEANAQAKTAIVEKMKVLAPNINTNGVDISYLDANGAPGCSPNCVMVKLTMRNLTYTLTTPFGGYPINLPTVSDTIIRESLRSATSSAC